MVQPMLASAALRPLRTVVLLLHLHHLLLLLLLLLLLTCGRTPVASSSGLAEFASPYDSIFSPLLKAMSQHGGSRWSPGLKKRAKPEHVYVKYLTEVFKKSSRVQRSLGGGDMYNTVRLIKPRDQCPAQSVKETFSQDLTYSLDQVRKKEQLLKSALLYNVECDRAVRSVCYLSIQEQEGCERCQLCPAAHYAINFTASTDGRCARNWIEVDVTSFLRPLLKLQKRNMQLLINITCPDEQRAGGDGSPLMFTLRSPPLLLYLIDTSKIAHQRSGVSAKAGVRPASMANRSHKQMVIKAEPHRGWKRRWKRDSSKSKPSEKGLDIHLPELLPSSEFPTSDCALYDFRVRFSQLKLDHWIVFPPKYNPRYCRGVCPRTMGFIYGSPVHTMVQNIIYEKLDSSVPRPSCVPSHYSPLSVMIFEEDGSYVYKEFEDMVATRCTCR